MNENFREMFSSLYSIKREVDREMMAYLDDIKSKRMREILLYYAKEGKRHLPWFTVLSAECLGGSRKRAVKCAALLEMLHKIALMVDDIVDRHDRRKGRLTPANVFGGAQVTLAGICGLAFAVRKIEEEMGRDIFRKVCAELESVTGGVLNELEGRKRGSASLQEHYAVNRKFFRLFTETGIAISQRNKLTPGQREGLLRYSEEISEIATIYDDAEDVLADMKSGKLRRIIGVLERFSMGRRISVMTEDEIKKWLMRGGNYKKIFQKIDARSDEAVKSLAPLPDCGAKNTLISLALFMKELHKEQKDMEIQRYIENLFSNMDGKA